MWTVVFLMSCWRSGRPSVTDSVGLAPAWVVESAAPRVGANGSGFGHAAPAPS